MDAGPELDAKLAEAMGIKVIFYGGPVPAYYMDEDRGADGMHLVPVRPFSCDVASIVAATEECRKAGKIDRWEVRSAGIGGEGDDLDSDATVTLSPKGQPWTTVQVERLGDSPAHALTLALLEALTRS